MADIETMSLFERQSQGADLVVQPPLSQAVGYVVVVVIGLVIAFGMGIVSWVLKRTVGEDNTKTEMFFTSNRSVRTGLTASAVISGWLWSTAMLGSNLVGYSYGVAGPFWFAAGCSPMIVFFAVLGIASKMKIPEAHTLLEIVRIRYGTAAHLIWIVLCLINNIIACANMLLGASAAISALTGMNITAATFLLPFSVCIYTSIGGIKATFLTDYIHTFTILIIACFFTVKVFTVNEISSVGHLWELMVAAGERNPVSGNQAGSYLTMTSKGAIEFGIIHIVANFGLVIMDTSYFIKAFSASPRAVVPGYVVGGIAYFAIPWGLGTLMSSVALGLENNPIFPTYPRRMTATEVGNGLVLPYAAIAVAGKGGAGAILVITFMAVTSTLSAQVIAVSSIISFDIYRQYFNRLATDADVIRWSHYGVMFFGLFAAAFSTGLHYGQVNLQWTLYMLGVLTTPGIFPTVFTILWSRQSKLAALLSPTLGMVTGIAVWLGLAKHWFGEVTVVSSGEVLPCLYGSVASTFSPAFYSIVITLIKPQRFDWASVMEEKSKLAFEVQDTVISTSSEDAALDLELHSASVTEKAHFKRWLKIASWWAAATFLGHWVLWPLPMYASKYVFGKSFFVAWLIVATVWLWGTMLIAGFYPVVDGRKQILAIFRSSDKLRKGDTGTPLPVDEKKVSTVVSASSGSSSPR